MMMNNKKININNKNIDSQTKRIFYQIYQKKMYNNQKINNNILLIKYFNL